MDEDRPTLPRLADIGAQPTDRSVSDDKAGSSNRQSSSGQAAESRSEGAPPPLHPPSMPSYPAVRSDLLHQPGSSAQLHRSTTQGQPFNPSLGDRHIPPPSPVYTQQLQYVDRGGHSQSAADIITATPSSAAHPAYSRTQTTVAEGGVTKPKKLHREVEQKRRMRMAEQIMELRKWVSNPNGGKTDKVSVLQDAVAFVKESAKKIEKLQEALERSREECTRLRSLLNKPHSQHAAVAMPGPQSQIGPPPPHVAPISRLGEPIHPSIGTIGGEGDLSHRSHFPISYGGYPERHIGTGSTTTGSDHQRVLGQGVPPSNFGLTTVPSLPGAGGGTARHPPSSQGGFANQGAMGHFASGPIRAPQEQGQTQQHQGEQLHPQQALNVSTQLPLTPGQRNLQQSLYTGSHEQSQGQSADDSQSAQHQEGYRGSAHPRTTHR